VSVVALVTWITAAAGGMYLLSIWLIEYDKDFQAAAATRLPPAVLAAHVLLAVGGLIVWAGYLFFDDDDLTWVAVLALGLAAVLGLIMAVRWYGVYRAGQRGRPGLAYPGGASPAAQNGGAHRPSLRLVAGSGRSAPGRAGPGRPDQGPLDFSPAGPGQPGLSQPPLIHPALSQPGPGRTGRDYPAPRPQLGPPERNFPLPVVIAHGLFAFVTLTLVVLVAFGVGGS
jgi:hypothetical protein